MAAYVNKSGKSHLLVEKFVKIHKCHRNILDQETKFLDQLKEKIEGYVKEMEDEKKIMEKIEIEIKVEVSKSEEKKIKKMKQLRQKQKK